MILQLHLWDAHEHPHLGSQTARPYGNGVLLWFQTDDFDAAVRRALDVRADVLEGPKVNPIAKHREVWMRDPDEYTVVIAGGYGDLSIGS